MKIGKALRVERLKLGLTQQQMCEGIISRPFYAKVESGKIRLIQKVYFKSYLNIRLKLMTFVNLYKIPILLKIEGL